MTSCSPLLGGPAVEDERAETLGGLDALDLRAGVVALRVLAAGDDDGHGRPRVDLEVDAAELARRGRRERSRAGRRRSAGRSDWVSGSPNRQLNSSTFGPSAVSISPA